MWEADYDEEDIFGVFSGPMYDPEEEARRSAKEEAQAEVQKYHDTMKWLKQSHVEGEIQARKRAALERKKAAKRTREEEAEINRNIRRRTNQEWFYRNMGTKNKNPVPTYNVPDVSENIVKSNPVVEVEAPGTMSALDKFRSRFSPEDINAMKNLVGDVPDQELFRTLSGYKDPYPLWFAKQGPQGRLKALRSMAKRRTFKRRRTTYRRRAPYRRRRYVRGRGPYYVTGGVSAPFGSASGGYYSEGFDKGAISGLGPYTVKRNSIVGDIDINSEPPIIRNSKTGEAVIIQHREYIKDITSASSGNPTDFKLETWDINPGNPNLFPWLSTIAQNFQEYEIRGMIAMVKTMSTDYSSTVQLGTIFGASDYNLHNADPTNKQMVEMLEYSNSCKPSRSLVLPIECEPSNNGDTHKYVAINGNYNGGDANLFDWGNLFIGSQGLPAHDAPIGEFWITYEVAFFKPILKQNVLDPLQHCIALNVGIRGVSNANKGGTSYIHNNPKNMSAEVFGSGLIKFDIGVLEDDHIMQLFYTAENNTPAATDLVSGTVYWDGPEPDLWYALSGTTPGDPNNYWSEHNLGGWGSVQYYELKAGNHYTLLINGAVADYKDTVCGVSALVNMFNTKLCGFMIPEAY